MCKAVVKLQHRFFVNILTKMLYSGLSFAAVSLQIAAWECFQIVTDQPGKTQVVYFQLVAKKDSTSYGAF